MLCISGAKGQGMAFVDSLLSVPYQTMVGNLTRSHRALLHALPIARAGGALVAEGRVYEQLAVVHHMLNQEDSAAWYGVKAVDAFRMAGDEVRLGEAYCTLGFHMKRTDLSQAFDYYRRGLPMLEKKQASVPLAAAYDNYGVVQEMAGQRDSALLFFRKALTLKEQLNDSNGIPYSLNKIAVALIPEQRYSEALDLMQRSDAIRQAINDRMGLADQAAYFGDLYQAWGRYPEAIAHFGLALDRASEVGFPYMRQYAYEHMAQCHEAMGNHFAALGAYKRAAEVRDSIESESSTRTILELKERFNASEKDRAIALLNEQAVRRQLYIWISLVSLVLVLVGGMLFHQTRQRRLRAERDAAIIAERERGLRAMVERNEAERGRIAQELHDSVGQQISGLKFRLEGAAAEDASLRELLAIAADAGQEVRDLAHQMMPRALATLGLVPALDEMLKRSLTRPDMQVRFDHFGIDGRLPQEIEVGAYRIAQELISNVIRHAHATEVNVQLLRNKGHLVLIVEDDGVGFDPVIAQGGIGMQSLSDRARLLRGSITFAPGGTRGTVATLRIPLDKQP
ncbi:MAG: hypothetical protein IPJ85_10525 [Flavobacteriales bacterium]|nr:hypothetical protein [Flavobacteriales bacterium]